MTAVAISSGYALVSTSHLASVSCPRFTQPVRLYALRSALLGGDALGDVVELFVRRKDAEQFVAECLAEEPGWADVLSVEPLELEFSAN